MNPLKASLLAIALLVAGTGCNTVRRGLAPRPEALQGAVAPAWKIRNGRASPLKKPTSIR